MEHSPLPPKTPTLNCYEKRKEYPQRARSDRLISQNSLNMQINANICTSRNPPWASESEGVFVCVLGWKMLSFWKCKRLSYHFKLWQHIRQLDTVCLLMLRERVEVFPNKVAMHQNYRISQKIIEVSLKKKGWHLTRSLCLARVLRLRSRTIRIYQKDPVMSSHLKGVGLLHMYLWEFLQSVKFGVIYWGLWQFV